VRFTHPTLGVMDAPFVLTRAQTRLVDRIAIDECALPGIVLMENAGRGTVEALLAVDPGLSDHGSVAILCGKGNNAGDGFVIARHLEIRGVPARALLLCAHRELAGDALVNYEVLTRIGADVVDLSAQLNDAAAITESLVRHASGAAWLVDAMLGTGAIGEPREPFRTAISWMNSQAAQRLAVDVPSGLDCDKGEAASVTLRADLTCTLVAAKPGLLLDSATPYVGELRVISIGVPRTVVERAAREQV
jgi:NAD(P)H-hydrate epimerase